MRRRARSGDVLDLSSATLLWPMRRGGVAAAARGAPITVPISVPISVPITIPVSLCRAADALAHHARVKTRTIRAAFPGLERPRPGNFPIDTIWCGPLRLAVQIEAGSGQQLPLDATRYRGPCPCAEATQRRTDGRGAPDGLETLAPLESLEHPPGLAGTWNWTEYRAGTAPGPRS